MFEEEDGDLEQDSDSEQVEITNTGPKSEATIKIPFGCNKYAEIARKVLEVDKPHFHEKQFSVEGEYLITEIKASSAKAVRNAVSAYFDQMLLCQETIEKFAIESEEEQLSLKSEEKEHADHTTLTSANSG